MFGILVGNAFECILALEIMFKLPITSIPLLSLLLFIASQKMEAHLMTVWLSHHILLPFRHFLLCSSYSRILENITMPSFTRTLYQKFYSRGFQLSLAGLCATGITGRLNGLSGKPEALLDCDPIGLGLRPLFYRQAKMLFCCLTYLNTLVTYSLSLTHARRSHYRSLELLSCERQVLINVKEMYVN